MVYLMQSWNLNGSDEGVDGACEKRSMPGRYDSPVKGMKNEPRLAVPSCHGRR